MKISEEYLINLLKNYTSEYPEEETSKSLMLEFLNTYKMQSFDRALSVGHITASAWLLDHAGQRALLTHHAKFDEWLQLGGHCDGDPDVLAVAIKEAKEESGIDCIEPVFSDIFDIDVHLIPENPKDPVHYHYDVRFLLRITQPSEYTVSEESKDLCWITHDPSSLPTQQESVCRMFRKWKENFVVAEKSAIE